jgi:hypothetical protein
LWSLNSGRSACLMAAYLSFFEKPSLPIRMPAGRISGASGCDRGNGCDINLQVIQALRDERLSFSRCYQG